MDGLHADQERGTPDGRDRSVPQTCGQMAGKYQKRRYQQISYSLQKIFDTRDRRSVLR